MGTVSGMSNYGFITSAASRADIRREMERFAHYYCEVLPNPFRYGYRIRTTAQASGRAAADARQQGSIASVRMRDDAVIFPLFGTLTPAVKPAVDAAILQVLAHARCGR